MRHPNYIIIKTEDGYGFSSRFPYGVKSDLRDTYTRYILVHVRSYEHRVAPKMVNWLSPSKAEKKNEIADLE